MVTERVNNDKNNIGARKVSGLLPSVLEINVIIETIKIMYPKAPRALIIGFLDMHLL